MSKEDIMKACNETKHYGYGVMYVLSNAYIPLAVKLLEGPDSRVGAAVLQYFRAFEEHSTEVKMCMAREAIEKGAMEVDMLTNIGTLKDGDHESTKRDIQSVVTAAKSMEDIIVKAILETGFLTGEEIVEASLLAKKAGADFIKSCTGIGP